MLDKFILFMTKDSINLIDVFFLAFMLKSFLGQNYVWFAIFLFASMLVKAASKQARRHVYLNKELK